MMFKKENTIANPKTGDNVIVYFVMFSIAILGIITLAIVNTKKKKIKKIIGEKKNEN